MPEDCITAEVMAKVIRNTQRAMEANTEYLNFLDSEIGDAEHGTTMLRGFTAANEKIDGGAYSDAVSMLRATGDAFMEAAGGAAGPLFGTLYAKGAAAIPGRKAIDKKDLATLLRAGLSGIRTISGGTKTGDKTLIDALSPAVETLEERVQRTEDGLIDTLEVAVVAAKEGMAGTIPLRAKKGRASYLGERSVGHQDPGATSFYLILRTMLETLKGNCCVKVERYEPSGMILFESVLIAG